MPFTLLACADLFTEKVNLEIPFPEKPTIDELRNHVQNQFTAEMRCLQPQNVPTVNQFNVAKIQIYDDVHLQWADLTSPQQLHEYDQLYITQPANPWHSDTEKDLPPPRPPTRPVPFAAHSAAPSVHHASPAPYYSQQGPVVPQYQQAPPMQHHHQQHLPPPQHQQQLSTGGLPQPMGAAQLAGERPNVPLEERIRVSFQELDEQHKGWIDAAELERGFRNRGVDFSPSTVNELFTKADNPREGRIDLQKWHAFAQVYPNTVDAVYYRGRDMRNEQQLREEIAQLQRELDMGRQKEQELRQAADAQAQQNQRVMAMLQENEGRMRSTADRRNLLEGQERMLIEQEVKLERQKDALRISMSKFKETASAFDRDAAQTGSPRRSRAPLTSDIPGI